MFCSFLKELKKLKSIKSLILEKTSFFYLLTNSFVTFSLSCPHNITMIVDKEVIFIYSSSFESFFFGSSEGWPASEAVDVGTFLFIKNFFPNKTLDVFFNGEFSSTAVAVSWLEHSLEFCIKTIETNCNELICSSTRSSLLSHFFNLFFWLFVEVDSISDGCKRLFAGIFTSKKLGQWYPSV